MSVTAEKLIMCPKCKAKLKVKNPKALDVVEVLCPHCSTRLRVTFSLESKPRTTDYETVIGSALSGYDVNTVLAAKKTGSHYRLVSGDRQYELADGENTIGRHSQTPQSTIQVITDSRRMSRRHARIEVVRLGDGSARARISNWENKNRTLVNGHELQGDDVLMLKDGMTIEMGDVKFRFEEY